jgi:NAD(P)-dependent dehydrogenase (short-subunit alcohol dehydrogenase family)
MDANQEKGAVLVTGTSTGIGRTTALQLDRLGFSVFASVRNERDAQALSSEASGKLTPVLMDVTDQGSIDRAKEQVSQVVGDAGLAGLVNNAGVGFVTPLEFVPLDELRWMFEVNVFGLLAVTQAFLPLLRQGRGRIVNVSSTASLFVAPFHGPYSASKLAVNGLSDALRLELKPHGVQVSAVVCGSIQTPIWEKGDLLVDRITKSFPSQAMELYGEPYRRLRAYFSRIGKAGVPPEAAARKIIHALTASRAKNTYYVGPDANFYKIADKLLFGRLRDWVILKSTLS